MVRQFLDKKHSKTVNEKIPENGQETRYVTLPYIGHYSKNTPGKISEMIKTFCQEKVNIKLVFTTCKIKSYFSTKHPLPKCFKSNVVYSFVCARCHSCYVGSTHLHYNTRLEQHLGSDKHSSIFKHLANNKESCNKDSFKILDNARTRYELALKESMQIKWRKPSLNIQKSMKFLNCSFNCVVYS